MKLKLTAFYSLIILFFNVIISGYAQNDYFFPEGVEFETGISSPQEFLGYPVGDFHTRIDRMAAYMQHLAGQSERAHYQVIGYTYEMRPQVILTITSPENYNDLERIRTEHMNSANPDRPAGDFDSMPAIIHLGYNVHGNEPSGTESAILMAYYLCASTNQQVMDFLENSVIFIEPALNPDGRDRHSSWVNHHKAKELVADPLDREHNESWPSGRTNHYWFDLNRDWLPLVHVESQNRVEFFHRWLPNVVTDYHEMGTGSTYFFEPTKPFGSENPIVPRSNYDGLNNLFANYFKDALDEIGSLYWTKEVYDNSYPGYGSTYPDIHGGLGLVFEQASSRGHLQETPTGEISFAFTIRNQLRTSIATVLAAVENRVLLHEHQRKFFMDAKESGKNSPVKGYVFGNAGDTNRSQYFLDLLLKHQIKCYHLHSEISINNREYHPGTSYFVPSDQSQYLMVRTMFEKVKTFADSVFYDASAWATALSYGIRHDVVTSPAIDTSSRVITSEPVRIAMMIPEAKYAYLFGLEDYNAHKALSHLLENGINAKVAFKSFVIATDMGSKAFARGSIMIPVADQQVNSEKLNGLINEASQQSYVEITPVSTGMSLEGVDLGSRTLDKIPKPNVIMVIGEGTSAYESGEIWHLMDYRVGMPITKVDISDFNRVDLDEYTVLILVSGNYQRLNKEKVKNWVNGGGTLIAQRTGSSWVARNDLLPENVLVDGDDSQNGKKDTTGQKRIDFINARDYLGARAIGGSFYEIDLDNTNPIGFGYPSRKVTVYRNSPVFLKPGKNPFATAGKYTEDPWVSGYIHPENLDKIKGSAAILTLSQGRGRVILFADNMNFRGMMYGTNKLFLNAVFFGPLIDVPNWE